MKHQESEKLAEHLLQIDDDLLQIADAIDTPEKMKAYTKRNRPVKFPTLPSLPTIKRIAAVAAMVALVTGLFFLPRPTPDSQEPILQSPTLPSFHAQETTAAPSIPTPTVPPDNPAPPLPSIPDNDTPILPWYTISDIEIKSMDMLNYYSAMKLLSTSGFNFLTQPLTHTKVKYNTEPPLNTEPPETTAPPESGPSDNVTTPPQTEPEIYFFDFQPDQTFYVSRVVFFQIRLTVPEGFLASKIGTGFVDVVITQNSYETMITFKNGDRYYSCLCIGSGANDANFTTYHADFSAHYYIDGFRCVKDLSLEENRFYVHFRADGQVTAMEIPFDPNADPQTGQVPLHGMTYICDVDASFTIQEIEDYFNSNKLHDSLAAR